MVDKDVSECFLNVEVKQRQLKWKSSLGLEVTEICSKIILPTICYYGLCCSLYANRLTLHIILGWSC